MAAVTSTRSPAAGCPSSTAHTTATSLSRRKLKLKAKFESGSSHFSF